jgi:hypothetical protein
VAGGRNRPSGDEPRRATGALPDLRVQVGQGLIYVTL